MLQAIVTLRNALAIEGVSLDDVGTRIQVGLMDPQNDVWLSQAKQIIVVLELLGDILEPLTYITMLAPPSQPYLCSAPPRACASGSMCPWLRRV